MLALSNADKKSAVHRGKLITYSDSDSIISDQFRTIRTNIKFLPGKKDTQIILITSPSNGNGKSTTIANLAVSIALQNDKVLLIDANLRNPVIHMMFNIPNQIGLTDLLLHDTPLSKTIYKSDIGNLDIITSGPVISNPAELLERDAMAKVLQSVENNYNVILIDSPSVLKSTETRILANLCDGVVMVVNRRKAKYKKLSESRKLLELVNAKLVGAIINEK